MWELDCEEGRALKNWCFWTVVLEKTLESPLDCKEIQPVHSEGDQPWDFFGRDDAKAETPVLWPPHAKSWLIGKDPDAGRDWGQKEKGTTGWGGWMASLTRWTWVWVNSGSWWWTGRPGVLQFMGSQRVTRLSDWSDLVSIWYSWSHPPSFLCSLHLARYHTQYFSFNLSGYFFLDSFTGSYFLPELIQYLVFFYSLSTFILLLASLRFMTLNTIYMLVTSNNRLVPNRKRSTSRLYIVTLFI